MANPIRQVDAPALVELGHAQGDNAPVRRLLGDVQGVAVRRPRNLLDHRLSELLPFDDLAGPGVGDKDLSEEGPDADQSPVI